MSRRSLIVLVLMCLGGNAWAPPPQPPLATDWSQTRKSPTFSGFAGVNIPLELKFSWAVSGLAGAPVTANGVLFQSQPEVVPGTGELSARSVGTGESIWSVPVFRLTTQQPAAVDGKVFVASSDIASNKSVYQAFDAADGMRLWATAPITSTLLEGSGRTSPIGHEVSLPYTGVVMFSGVFDADAVFPEINVTIPVSSCMGFNTSDGSSFGWFASRPIDNTRPVKFGTLLYNIFNYHPFPPFVSVSVVCICTSLRPNYRQFEPQTSKGVTQLVRISTTTPFDSALVGTLPCSTFCNQRPYHEPTARNGNIFVATDSNLLCIRDGSRLAARDPASIIGATLWISSIVGSLDRNSVAAGNGRIVALSRTTRGITTLLELDGTVASPGTVSLPISSAVFVTTAVTMTNNAVLFGDSEGIVHILDPFTLQERQALAIAEAPIVGEIAIVGDELLVSAADGTLVKLGAIGFECSALSPGYPQNGHQAIGPGGVNTLSGNLVFSVEDVSIPLAGLWIKFVRTYNSQRLVNSAVFSPDGTVNGQGFEITGTPLTTSLGPGWTHNIRQRPTYWVKA